MVSVVIPCYNPIEYVFETIASVRAQTYRDIEIILVNDGTDRPESLRILDQAARLVDQYIEQENRGLGGARNTGFRSARSDLVVPLDADDLIRPEYVSRCKQALDAHPAAAFAYTGMDVFGRETRVDAGADYDLYRLLDQNHVTCAALIRKADWQSVGGYDETGRCCGYEDWEFWLHLGAHGRYGALVPEPLFRYRKHGPSLYDIALARHDEITAYIRGKHPELYSREARLRIKAEWQPAVCIRGPHLPQTIGDVESLQDGTAPLPARSKAAVFVVAGPDGAGPQAAEMAALAVWGGKTTLQLPDGSLALSREAAVGLTVPVATRSGVRRAIPAVAPGRLRLHFMNAGLNSRDAWLRHPVTSALRLVPLGVKERINQAVGRPLFDLSFYLQFQPSSVLVGNHLVEPLRYVPQPASRRRIALVTPHLGPGGAERVLLDIATALDRDRFEILLLATQSSDDRWLPQWRAAAGHVYDLAALVPPQRMSAAVYSIVTNWGCEAVLVQNSLFGYAALPQIRKDASGARILDLVHAANGDWDQIAATAAVSGAIDIRIAVSDEVRRRLLGAGVPGARVRQVRNGVDLERFRPRPRPPAGAPRRVLFGGRLDPVKRPLLLVDIAERLAVLRATRDFRIVIAGDGPESSALRDRARRKGVANLFEFLGHVEDMAPLYVQADVLVLPSRVEGVPLVILEAMASGRPVVASKVGAVAEAVDPACGVLIESGEGEVQRFAEALHQLLNDHALREALGNAGRGKAEAEFDAASVRAAYRQLFE